MCVGPLGAIWVTDDATHTLLRCSAFEGERDALVRKISLHGPSTLVLRMLESETSWEAMAAFSGLVMLRKEEADRAREQNSDDT